MLKGLLTEICPRLALDALVEQDRLTKEFSEKLLPRGHAGEFSVCGRRLILDGEPIASHLTLDQTE